MGNFTASLQFGCFKKYFDVYFAFMLIEFHPWTWNLINYFEIEKMEIVLKSFFFGQQKKENFRTNLLPQIKKLLCWSLQVFFSFKIVLKFHTKNSSRWMSKKGRLRRQRYLKMSWNDNLCQRKSKTGEKLKQNRINSSHFFDEFAFFIFCKTENVFKIF